MVKVSKLIPTTLWLGDFLMKSFATCLFLNDESAPKRFEILAKLGDKFAVGWRALKCEGVINSTTVRVA